MAYGTRYGNKYPRAGYGTKYPADAAAAPAFSGVAEAIVAAGGAAPMAVFGYGRQASVWSGNVALVRRSVDAVTENFGFVPATHVLDEAGIAAHCVGTTPDSNGFLGTWYEQQASARDIAQGTAGFQPKVFDSATGLLKRGSAPYIDFTGGKVLTRADAFGITGTSAITICYVGKYAAAGAIQNAVRVGALGSVGLMAGVTAAGTLLNNRRGDTLSFRREFTPVNPITNVCGYVHSIAAGADYSASTCRQDGNDLVQSGVLAGVMGAVAATESRFGSTGAFAGVDELYGVIILNYLPSAPVLAVIEAENAALKALAGF